MSTTPETPALIKTVGPIKITISGEKSVGKSCLAQLIAGTLKLHGHDVKVIEKEGDDKVVVDNPAIARNFRDARTVKIEVKESKP